MFLRIADRADVDRVKGELVGLGQWASPVRGTDGRVSGFELGASSAPVPPDVLMGVAGVTDVLRSPSAHPRIDAQSGGAISFGREGYPHPLVIAGPCGVESEAMIHAAAAMVASAGASMLRGGAFKPRTSPYSFSGHGRRALAWMRAAADAHGLGMVTEVMSELEVEAVASVADVLQVGSRNMQNFALLAAVGRAGLPVLLKRGMAARIEEWILAGEHLLVAGAAQVVFCERGVLGFDPSTRNTLDLGAVCVLKHALGQPVLVDPSHAVGRRDLILPLSRAALAAGADGLIVEAHPDARSARSDGPQALDADGLRAVVEAASR